MTDSWSPEDDMLIAEYVLGVLPHEERAALSARVAAEPPLQSRLRFWEDQLAPLGAELEPVQPPARVLGALEQRLFPRAAAPQAIWGSLAFWRGVAAALLVLLVAGAGWFAALRDQGVAASYVASLSQPAGPLRIEVLYDGASGRLKLNRVSGTPAAGRDFQLWLIAGTEPPISLGVVPADARASLVLPAAARANLADSAVIAISDEPRGGSPTGQPTGAVLATAPLTAM